MGGESGPTIGRPVHLGPRPSVTVLEDVLIEAELAALALITGHIIQLAAGVDGAADLPGHREVAGDCEVLCARVTRDAHVTGHHQVSGGEDLLVGQGLK